MLSVDSWCPQVMNAACTLFFFNATATTEIYTLSLHDALPISDLYEQVRVGNLDECSFAFAVGRGDDRSEEHTSELQSRGHLVCRLLLEKKKKNNQIKQIVKIGHYHSTSSNNLKTNYETLSEA